MPADTPDGTARRVYSRLGAVASRRSVSMALLGLLAGASLGVIDQQSVVLPVLGGVPGWALAVTGLAVSGVAYWRVGGCDGCGDPDCGCDGACTVES